MIETIASLFTIIGGIFAVFKFLQLKNRRQFSSFLSGTVTSGAGVANRIIALFEAHDVKKTQIYRLLGDRFPEIKPSLDADKLQELLCADLIDRVCELFGVRKAWIEGEAARIYEPLCHYKDLPAFAAFVRELKERNPQGICSLTALKPSHSSDDLYADTPDIALFFSEPIAELDCKTIFRYNPIYGPFPWDHIPARYCLCAFFNIVSETRLFPVKGYSVSAKHVARVSAGEAIPLHKTKISGIWYPADYAYPMGEYNGRVKRNDWHGLLEYFEKDEERYLLTGFSPENIL